MGAGGGVPAAGESELFTWPSAQLFLVHEQEQALLQRGAFRLLLAHHSHSAHLVVVEASVGDVRWPVGKDCLVTSAAAPDSARPASCFLFTLRLPASQGQLMTYQLLLFDHHHSTTSYHILQIGRLQSLLALYATLHLQVQPTTNPGLAKSSLKELEEAAGKYWAARVDIEADTFKKQGAKELELTDSCQSSHGSSSTTTSSAGGISKRMMKRMQRARRISAVSKLFSKAVVGGLINAKAHIVHEAVGSRTDEQITSTHADIEGNGVKPAVANVDAITKVVEAVEGSSPHRMKRSANAAYYMGCETVLDISALATWTINELGLRLVLNAAMAANNVQAARMGGAVAEYSASAAKAVESETACGAVSNSSSSSHLSSLQSGSTQNLPTSPSARRPPRPPRRVDVLLNEVSSPIPVYSNSHIVK